MKTKKRLLIHWCMNTKGHRNGQPHSYYVELGSFEFRQWLSIKLRRKNAVMKACPVCGTKDHVAVSRIVVKEIKDA